MRSRDIIGMIYHTGIPYDIFRSSYFQTLSMDITCQIAARFSSSFRRARGRLRPDLGEAWSIYDHIAIWGYTMLYMCQVWVELLMGGGDMFHFQDSKGSCLP